MHLIGRAFKLKPKLITLLSDPSQAARVPALRQPGAWVAKLPLWLIRLCKALQ
jgi:hypothetical protein